MAAVLERFDEYKHFFEATGIDAKKAYIDDVKTNIADFYKSHANKEAFSDVANIEHEAAALYQIFQDTKDEDAQKLKQSGVIEMLAFTNQLLLTHFEYYHGVHAEAYLDHDKINLYRKQIDELRAFCDLDPKFMTAEEKENIEEDKKLTSVIDWILKETKKKFLYLWELVCHPSLLRDQIGWTNLSRIFWIFYHFSLNKMLLLVKDAPFIEQLGKVLGRPIDIDAIYKSLNMPNDVLNVLSVAFFGIKLIIDLIIIVKHTMTDEGLGDEFNTSAQQRFCAELEKRAPNIVNCFVWGGVNAVTNYPQILQAMGLPVELAMPIVAGVLTFDLGLSFWLWHRDSAAYDKSFKTLTAQINAKESLSKPLIQADDDYLQVLYKMLDVENEKWAITNGVYQLNSLAAVSILTAFTTSLFLTNPLLILGCYLISCFCLSMYASAAPDGDYAKYLVASQRLAHAQGQSNFSIDDLAQLKELKAQTWSTFVSTLFERAFVPLSLITLIAINPAIGITTSIGYITYKLYQWYSEAKKAEEAQPIKLNQFGLFKEATKVPEGTNEASLFEEDELSGDMAPIV